MNVLKAALGRRPAAWVVKAAMVAVSSSSALAQTASNWRSRARALGAYGLLDHGCLVHLGFAEQGVEPFDFAGDLTLAAGFLEDGW
jgi:hypothetical protein